MKYQSDNIKLNELETARLGYATFNAVSVQAFRNGVTRAVLSVDYGKKIWVRRVICDQWRTFLLTFLSLLLHSFKW